METHYDLLSEAVNNFEHNPQVFEVIRDEWEVSSGFFAKDIEAKAIRKALGDDGRRIVGSLNEKAYLRSVVYYMAFEDHAPALQFMFCTQAHSYDLLIYIYSKDNSEKQSIEEANTICWISEEHGPLLPLSIPGWYYIEDYSTWHAE